MVDEGLVVLDVDVVLDPDVVLDVGTVVDGSPGGIVPRQPCSQAEKGDDVSPLAVGTFCGEDRTVRVSWPAWMIESPSVVISTHGLDTEVSRWQMVTFAGFALPPDSIQHATNEQSSHSKRSLPGPPRVLAPDRIVDSSLVLGGGHLDEP